MASPQKENGYTAIANELLEVIYKSKLSSTKISIILLIARYTYGFNRKEKNLSTTFIATGVCRDRRSVQRDILELIELNILISKGSNDLGKTRILGINKNYDQWKFTLGGGKIANGKNVAMRQNCQWQNYHQGGGNLVPKVVAELPPKKEKEERNIIKTSSSCDDEQKSDDVMTSKNLFEKLWNAYPSLLGKRKNQNECVKVFTTKCNTQEEVDEILVRLEKLKDSENWKKENGRYIPKFLDFLTDERWNDVQLESDEHISVYEKRKIATSDELYRDMSIDEINELEERSRIAEEEKRKLLER